MPQVICPKKALKLFKPMFWSVAKDAPLQSTRAWDLRKKNRKKYWNRGDNKP